MSLLMQPAHVPLGWVQVGGARLPVFINPPWLRAIGDVSGAVDNIITNSITNSSVAAFLGDQYIPEEPLSISLPGPAGADGVTTIAGSLYDGDCGEPAPLFPSAAATLPVLDFGKYTPTLTNVANLAASTAYECQWLRVGNVVTMSGRVDVDPSGAGASTQLGISLPVASAFGALENGAGVAFASGVASQGAALIADAANDRFQMQWIATDVANRAMYFTATYEVI